MVGDTLYNNKLYFTSTLYDDEVVNSFLYDCIEKSYSRSMTAENIVHYKDIYPLEISKFKINPAINSKYGFKSGTYTYALPNMNLIVESFKKKFINTFGYDKIIKFSQILENPKIFIRAPMLYFNNDVLFYGLKVVYTYDRQLILGIEIGTSGVSRDYMTQLIDNNSCVELHINKIYTNYRYSGSFSSLFSSGAISGYDSFPMSKTTLISDIMTLGTNHNSWDIYYPSSNNSNLLYQTCGSVMTNASNNMYFAYTSGMDNEIKSKASTGTIICMQQPYRSDVLVYSSEMINSGYCYVMRTINGVEYPTITPNIQPQLINSVGAVIYAVPQSDFRISYPTQLTIDRFPSSATISDKLRIDIYDYPKSDTGAEYLNPFTRVGEIYTQYNKGSSDIIESTIRHWTPSDLLPYDFSDFLSSPYKDDIRAYKLVKLKEILDQNPLYFKKLQEILNRKATGWFTWECFAENDTLPVANDTSGLSISDRDDIVYFDSPQNYIVVHTEVPDPPVTLFINGWFIVPTLVKTFGYDTYIYFPQSTEELYGPSMAKVLKATPDKTIEKHRDIILDVFEGTSRLITNQKSNNLTFVDTTSAVSLYDPKVQSSVRLNDLVFYNAITKEIIDSSKFGYIYEVRKSLIRIDQKDISIETQLNQDPIQYLISLNDEYFKTTDRQAIIISEDREEIRLDDPSDFTYGTAKLNTDALRIYLKDPALIGIPIIVATTDNYALHHFKYEDITGDPDVEPSKDYYQLKLTIPNWTHGSDPSHFRFFMAGNKEGPKRGLHISSAAYGDAGIDGLNPAEQLRAVSISQTHFGGDLTIRLTIGYDPGIDITMDGIIGHLDMQHTFTIYAEYIPTKIETLARGLAIVPKALQMQGPYDLVQYSTNIDPKDAKTVAKINYNQPHVTSQMYLDLSHMLFDNLYDDFGTTELDKPIRDFCAFVPRQCEYYAMGRRIKMYLETDDGNDVNFMADTNYKSDHPRLQYDILFATMLLDYQVALAGLWEIGIPAIDKTTVQSSIYREKIGMNIKTTTPGQDLRKVDYKYRDHLQTFTTDIS